MRHLAMGLTTVMLLLAPAIDGAAQGTPQAAPPLVIAQQGSFFIGGEKVHSDFTYGRTPMFGIGPGSIQRNQMYVEYQIPQTLVPGARPIILVHGGGLSGVEFDTTPDGREGWKTYFVRHGFPVYVIDWSSRGRSGFDPAPYNQAARTQNTADMPAYLAWTYEVAWTLFRFGPKPGETNPGVMFPLDHIDAAMKQALPMLDNAVDRKPTIDDLVALIDRIGPAIVMAHSAAGSIGIAAALRSIDRVQAVVGLEPSHACGTAPGTPVTDDEARVLAHRPFLTVWGDYIDKGAFMAGPLAACEALAGKLRAMGGVADSIILAQHGLPGHTHMYVMDKGNDDVAKLILEWLDQNAR